MIQNSNKKILWRLKFNELEKDKFNRKNVLLLFKSK